MRAAVAVFLLLASCETPPPATPAHDLLPTAKAVLGAYSNRRASLTRSGGAVVFISNRDGLPQLYVGDVVHPAAAPRRLPSPPERVAGATLTSDERSVLFLSDVAADRNFHIFRVGLDGTNLSDLTPGPEVLHRDPPIVPLGRDDLFAYSAHAASSEKTRVYLQAFDGTPARDVYADDRGGTLLDISKDGGRLLFVRWNSDQDTVLSEIDAASGRATRIFPPEGELAAVSAAYSAAADRIFISAQWEKRRPELLAMDAKTHAIVARYADALLPDGAIDNIAVSPAGDGLAIAVDGGNHHELRLLDPTTLALRKDIDVPMGAGNLGGYRADGKQLTVDVYAPSSPPDIVAVDSTSGVTTPLRADARPMLASLGALDVSIESVEAFDGLKIPTNIYRPRRAGKAPTIVLVHGGPSGSADVRWNPEVRFFSSLGYAVVEPNIRGSSGFGIAYQMADDKEKRIGALRDMETINRWTKSQPWCDPNRVVVMGTSYGGYMTLLVLGRQPKMWRAGIDLSGMSDLRTMEKLEDQGIRVFDETEFGILGKEDDLLYEWSPLKYVSSIESPVFIYQGAKDPVTPQNEADQMVKALRERKVPVEYLLLANEGHGIVREENRADFLVRSARFLETYTK